MERTGHLLGVLEKFAEKRASDQLRYKAAQVELDMYPRDLRQHRSRVGITREFSAQNAEQQPTGIMSSPSMRLARPTERPGHQRALFIA